MRPRRRLTDHERMLRSVPEAAYMRQIIEAAEWLGWITYHVNDSRRDNPGFPDLVLVGKPAGPNAGRLIFLEVKTETGDLRKDQLVWLGALSACQGVEAHVIRPRDVDRVMELLGGAPVSSDLEDRR